MTGRPGAARRAARLLSSAWCVVALLAPRSLACPVCSSDAGVRVRRAILGPDLGWNATAALLPFLVMFSIAAWFRRRGPARLRPLEHDR